MLTLERSWNGPGMVLDPQTLLLEELQGPSRIVDCHRCVTAPNLSKQFSICNCCLRSGSLLPAQTSERASVALTVARSRQTPVFSLRLRLLTFSRLRRTPSLIFEIIKGLLPVSVFGDGEICLFRCHSAMVGGGAASPQGRMGGAS